MFWSFDLVFKWFAEMWKSLLLPNIHLHQVHVKFISTRLNVLTLLPHYGPLKDDLSNLLSSIPKHEGIRLEIDPVLAGKEH